MVFLSRSLVPCAWTTSSLLGSFTLLLLGCAQEYTSCAPGRYGPRCEGKCNCGPFEDCNEGLEGDGSCLCAIGQESRCGSSVEDVYLAPAEDARALGLGSLSQLVLTNSTLGSLRVDPDGSRQVRQVFNASVSRVRPTKWKASTLRLALFNSVVAKRLGLAPETVEADEAGIAEVFSGRSLLPGSQPFAHAYGGHQFGSWAGQLGDGRAISLGEVLGFPADGVSDDGPRSWKWEVALKGAGKTPYSRGGDGRAALANAAREFFAPIFLEAAGVPSTATLAVVASDASEDRITRDEWYDGKIGKKRPGIVTRISPCFLRFGSFQLAAKRQGVDGLALLAEFALEALARMEQRDDGATAYLSRIQTPVSQWHREECFFAQRSSPSCAAELISLPKSLREEQPESHLLAVLRCFLERVTLRTAALIAAWMAVGFAHGVMNTDNLSVLGITLDLNVFGFLAKFDPEWAPNHIDDDRRYAFGAQPEIAKWNLRRLADALTGSSFTTDRERDARSWTKQDAGRWLPSESAASVENDFDQRFQKCYNARMQLRFGLPVEENVDEAAIGELVESWHAWLTETGADYPRASRGLAELGDGPVSQEAVRLAAHAGVDVTNSVKSISDTSQGDLVEFLTKLRRLHASYHTGDEWRAAIRAAVPTVSLRSHILREAARFTELDAGRGRLFLDGLQAAVREPFNSSTLPLEGPVWDKPADAWRRVRLDASDVHGASWSEWLHQRLSSLPPPDMQQLTTSCGAQ